MALILIGVIVLATETPNLNLMDGAIRYKGLDTLLAHGIDTKMKYSFIGPLFGAPLWYLGRVVESSRWRYQRGAPTSGPMNEYFIFVSIPCARSVSSPL